MVWVCDTMKLLSWQSSTDISKGKIQSSYDWLTLSECCFVTCFNCWLQLKLFSMCVVPSSFWVWFSFTVYPDAGRCSYPNRVYGYVGVTIQFFGPQQQLCIWTDIRSPVSDICYPCEAGYHSYGSNVFCSHGNFSLMIENIQLNDTLQYWYGACDDNPNKRKMVTIVLSPRGEPVNFYCAVIFICLTRTCFAVLDVKTVSITAYNLRVFFCFCVKQDHETPLCIVVSALFLKETSELVK